MWAPPQRGCIQPAAPQCLHPPLWRWQPSSCLCCCLVLRDPDNTGGRMNWCFCNTVLQFSWCSSFSQCFLQCFVRVCLKCYCMQCWEWIIPCYEFIQRPKGPLICTGEFLMNRSQLGPESYEVRLSSSLSSRWTVSRGLSDIQREKFTAEGKTWGSLFLRDQPRKCSKIKCAFLAFSFEQITPPKTNPHHNSLKIACKVKERETSCSKLKWQPAIPIPYIHTHQHSTKDYGWVGAVRNQRQPVNGKMINQLMTETWIFFLHLW